MDAAIEALVAAGMTLGVCTSKRRDFAVKILDMLGLRRHFEFVDGGDIGIAKASQLERLAATDCVSTASIMVGDRAIDISAAAENGMRSIGVTWGFAVAGELESAGAEHIIERPADLVTAVRGRPELP